MSVKVGQSMNFDPEIPESNTSKLANKFIPMQLRTQPSNLGMGHLQRVNTTLLGDISPGKDFEDCCEKTNIFSCKQNRYSQWNSYFPL